MQGIRNKVPDIEVILRDLSADCFCVNEHWLHPDEFLCTKIKGFTAITGFSRTIKKRGGVGIYLRDKLDHKDLNLTKFSIELHCEVAGILIKSLNAQVLTAYRSPDGDLDTYYDIMSQVLDKIDLTIRTILVGDFNVHFENPNNKDVNQLNFFFSSYNMFPVVEFNTRDTARLDNLFSNFTTEQSTVEPYNLSGLSDHSGIVFSMLDPHEVKNNERITYRPITDVGLENLHQDLGSCNWATITESAVHIEDKFSKFINILTMAMDKHFPTKTKVIKSNSRDIEVNWFHPTLRDMRERLQTLSLLHRRDPILVPTAMVNSYRRLYRAEIVSAKRTAHDNFINNSSNKSLAMWKIIKSQSNTTSTQTTPSNNLNAEVFNTFFTNIADKIVKKLHATPKNFRDYLIGDFTNIIPFKFHLVTQSMVTQKIQSLKNSNSKDCFEINTKIIKYIKTTIAKPLTDLFNMCIQASHFPDILKTAKVVPIFKNKGCCEDETNYRPISLLPIISKILESLLKDQISTYFEHNNIFTESQFGFRNKKSTTLAINQLTEYIANGFENKLDTYASFLDLTKAFDCISFDILLHKLTYYNFDQSSVRLVESFIKGRAQYVSFNKELSKPQKIHHGVVQGSVLGPLLFLIYINDLPNFCDLTNLLLILFADDTTTLQQYHHYEQIITKASENQEHIENWFLANKLSLNISKTQNINFSLRTAPPPTQCDDAVKFLGVYLDPGLTWECHINNLSSKLSKIIYLIRNISKLVSTSTLLTAYYGYFCSNMSYAVLIWGHATKSEQIFKLQRRCIRIIAGLKYRDCCRSSFRELKLLTFPCVFILNCLTYIKNNQNSFRTHSEVHSHLTRNRDNLVPSHHRLERSRRGTDYWGIKFFNVLPQHIRELGERKFIGKLKYYLIKNAFYSFEEYLSSSFEF